MTKFMLIVFTDPVEGKAAEYDQWYDNIHLDDVVDVPGIAAAQRFRLRSPVVGALPNRNLALYEIDAADPDGVIAEIYARSGSSRMVISAALDQSVQNVALFEAVTDRIMSS